MQLQIFFTGKSGDEELLKAQIAKELRIERLRQVRMQSRAKAASQSRLYRELIDDRKGHKRAEIQLIKQTEVMQQRRELEESYKHSLLETGRAHRQAETTRKKISADGRIQKRKLERQNAVSEQRFQEALIERKVSLSREERRLDILRENLRTRHDIGAHNREDAAAVAAMWQARAEYVKRSKKVEDVGETGITIKTEMALQTDIDITRRSKIVRVEAKVVRHGTAACPRNEAKAVKIDRVHENRKAVIKELKLKWKQEHRVELAKEKRIEIKRKGTFATSLSALDRLDRSPERLNRIKNVADVRKANQRALEVPDRDTLLMQFDDIFFNPYASNVVDTGNEEGPKQSLIQKKHLDDTSDESSAHSSPNRSFEGSHRITRERADSDHSGAEYLPDSAMELLPRRELAAPSSPSDFDGFRCQKFSSGELYAAQLDADQRSGHLDELIEIDTDVDESVLDQSMYSQGALQLPFVDEADIDGSEQDNFAVRGSPIVNNWTRIQQNPHSVRGRSPPNMTASQSVQMVHNDDGAMVSVGKNGLEVPGWTDCENIFATKIPPSAAPENDDITNGDSFIEQDCDIVVESLIDNGSLRSRASSIDRSPVDIDICRSSRLSDVYSVHQSYESNLSHIGGGEDVENGQLFFENEEFTDLDINAQIVTSPDVNPPPPPSLDASVSQQWFDDASGSYHGSDINAASTDDPDNDHGLVHVLGASAAIAGVVVRITDSTLSESGAGATTSGTEAAAHASVLYADVNIPITALPEKKFGSSSAAESDMDSYSPRSSSVDSGNRLQLNVNRPFVEDELVAESLTAVLGAVIPGSDSSDDSMKIDPQLYEHYTYGLHMAATSSASATNSAAAPSSAAAELPPLTLSITPDTSHDNIDNVEHGVNDSWREDQLRLGHAPNRAHNNDHDLSGGLSMASTVFAYHDEGNQDLSQSTLEDFNISCTKGLEGHLQQENISPMPDALQTLIDGKGLECAMNDDIFFETSPQSRDVIAHHRYSFKDMNDSISSSSSGENDEEAQGDPEVDRQVVSQSSDGGVAPPYSEFPSPSFGKSTLEPHHDGHCDSSEDNGDDRSSQSSLSWSADQSKSTILKQEPIEDLHKPAQSPPLKATGGDVTDSHDQEAINFVQKFIATPLPPPNQNIRDKASDDGGLDTIINIAELADPSNDSSAMRSVKDVTKRDAVDLFGGASSVEDSGDDSSIGLDEYNISLDEGTSKKHFDRLPTTDIDDVDAKFDALLAYASAQSRSSKASGSSSSTSVSFSVTSDSSSSLELNISTVGINRIGINQDRRDQVKHSFNRTAVNRADDESSMRGAGDLHSLASDSLNQYQSVRSSPSLSIEFTQPFMRSSDQRRSEAGQAIASTYIRHISTSQTASERMATSLLTEAIISDDSLNGDASEDSLSITKPAAANIVKNAPTEPRYAAPKTSASISSKYQQFQINQYKYVAPPKRYDSVSKGGLQTKTVSSTSAARSLISGKVPAGARDNKAVSSTAKEEANSLDLSDMPILQEFETRLRKIESELTHYDILSTSLNAGGGDLRQTSLEMSSIGLGDSVSLNSSELNNLHYREQRLAEASSAKRGSSENIHYRFGVDRDSELSVDSARSIDIGALTLDNQSSTESESLQYLYFQATNNVHSNHEMINADTTLDEIKSILSRSNVENTSQSYVDREVAAALKELEDSDSDSDQDLSLSINSIVGEMERRAESRVQTALNLSAKTKDAMTTSESRVETSAQFVSTTSSSSVDRASKDNPTAVFVTEIDAELRQVFSRGQYNASSTRREQVGRSSADLTAYSLDAFLGSENNNL